MSKWISTLLLVVFLLILNGRHPEPALGASDLLSAVNAYRSANGLYAYNDSLLLDSSAQKHSDYQASLGTWTHTGADGSDETQRAYNVGYGSGARVVCDEIVAITKSPEDAIYNLWQDSVHKGILLNSLYVDAGGGESSSGGLIYYTLDACYVVGGAAAQPVSAQQATQGPFISPLTTSTPGPDGSIVHVVQYGQSFMMIANAYSITTQEGLLALAEQNHLLKPYTLYVGDKLIIQLPYTPTPTSEYPPTRTPGPDTSTPQGTATRKPTARPTVTPAWTATPVVTATPAAGFMAQLVKSADPALVGIGIVFAVGLLLMGAGLVLKRR